MIAILKKLLLYIRRKIGYNTPYMQNYKKFNNKRLDNTRISNTTYIGNSSLLSLGNNCYIGHYNIIDASNGITIADGCQFGSHISMYTHSSHIAIRLYGKQYTKHHNRHIGYIKGSISIGKYSFIGSYSLIDPDVHLGMGSIVQAFSHVKKGTYPNFAILAGNPAVIIGDTRNIDAKYLANNNELKEYYNEWQ
jgi:acetyltransferase-like isoleucine patch superfamily enzyme